VYRRGAEPRGLVAPALPRGRAEPRAAAPDAASAPRGAKLTRPKNDAASDVFLKANGLACQPPWSDPRGMTGPCAGHPAEAVLLQDQTVGDIAADLSFTAILVTRAMRHPVLRRGDSGAGRCLVEWGRVIRPWSWPSIVVRD
jgi:hypothetical protein